MALQEKQNRTPEKDLSMKPTVSLQNPNNTSDNDCNNSMTKVTPSPLISRQRDNVQKQQFTPMNVGPIDKATGLTIGALNNLYMLLPSAKKKNPNTPLRKELDQEKVPSPRGKGLSSAEMWEATGTVLPGVEKVTNLNDTPRLTKFSPIPKVLTPMQKLRRNQERSNKEHTVELTQKEKAALVSQLESTKQIRQLQEANSQLRKATKLIMMKVSSLDNNYRQKRSELFNTRARCIALEQQLQTRRKERRTQEKRNKRQASKRDELLTTRKEALLQRIIHLEQSIVKEKGLARNKFLEREDEFLLAISEKKRKFEKSRKRLIERNKKLRDENQALRNRSKRKVKFHQDHTNKRLKTE